MRTPVVLVAGRGDADGVVRKLMHEPGTVVVEHDFDGQVVLRRVTNLQHGVATVAERALELIGGCISCTTRNDLLILLRRLHRRDHVRRIVIRLAPWLEPQPMCQAIHRVPVSMGPGYLDGPAARDVQIAAVVTTIDSTAWLGEALGADELADGRTVAQVAVGQAEFADVLVLTGPDPTPWTFCADSPRPHGSPLGWTGSNSAWHTWNPMHGAAPNAVHTTHCWSGSHPCTRRARCPSSNSTRPRRFIRSAYTAPSASCSTG